MRGRPDAVAFHPTKDVLVDEVFARHRRTSSLSRHRDSLSAVSGLATNHLRPLRHIPPMNLPRFQELIRISQEGAVRRRRRGTVMVRVLANHIRSKKRPTDYETP